MFLKRSNFFLDFLTINPILTQRGLDVRLTLPCYPVCQPAKILLSRVSRVRVRARVRVRVRVRVEG